jgi:hemerythrin-like domain-containing protein
MCNGVLVRLREEHERFEQLFAETERLCTAIEVRGEIGVLSMKAIAWYFTEGAQNTLHQALEDRLSNIVLEHVPGFALDIYDLHQDHQKSRKWAAAFANALDALTDDPYEAQKSVVRTARAYIGHERVHYMSEEEILFPYAQRHLTPGEWAELRRQSEERDVIVHPEHAAILRTILRYERT